MPTPSDATVSTSDLQLSEVRGMPARVAKLLAKESVHTAAQVLLTLPFRHEDRRHMESPALHATETPQCHRVTITKCSRKFFGRRRGAGVFEAEAAPVRGGGMGAVLTLRWWNMPFMSKTIAEGLEMIVYGRIKEHKGRLFMDHPEYEIMGGDEEAGIVHTGRITPIYRLRGGVTQKALRTASWFVLEAMPDLSMPDILPQPSEQGEFAGWTRARALREAHFPKSMEDLEKGRRYLALEEFYVYQLQVVRRRQSFIGAGGHAHRAGKLARDFEAALPFEFTAAQRRSLLEIQHDMAQRQPMNRLLHGDVGSGKTVVALAAMLGAVEAGRQAALMAPTQILAEQHFLTARKWLEPLGVRVGLRTGSREEDGSGIELFEPNKKLSGKPQVMIGTHALLHDTDLIHNVGMVVIDEQHRFGVAQRARLIQKGNTPDVLVMTATPIPRTLTLTIYGDLDVSTLDERPSERGRILTKVRSAKKQTEALQFLREQLEQGRQAFLVYPLIEESESLDVTAAKKAFEEWHRLLQPFQTGLLHGRLGAEEKEQIMRRFRSGAIDALVSTTVIEVGVDVPNANVMYVHHAERFGLAQLHQLRGRVGRGTHTSYCVLFVDDKDEEAKERLAVLEETTDGFRISEEDLKRRGPGDVLGKAQSGQAPLRFAELLADTRLVRLARQLAEKTLEEDPDLREPRFAVLREALLKGDGLPSPSQLQ